MDTTEYGRIAHEMYLMGIVLSNIDSDFADIYQNRPALARYILEHASLMYCSYREVWESEVHFGENYINLVKKNISWGPDKKDAWRKHAELVRSYMIGA